MSSVKTPGSLSAGRETSELPKCFSAASNTARDCELHWAEVACVRRYLWSSMHHPCCRELSKDLKRKVLQGPWKMRRRVVRDERSIERYFGFWSPRLGIWIWIFPAGRKKTMSLFCIRVQQSVYPKLPVVVTSYNIAQDSNQHNGIANILLYAHVLSVQNNNLGPQLQKLNVSLTLCQLCF